MNFQIGYYRPDPVKEYTETSEGGDHDFLSRLARDWEQASEPIQTKFNVRRVILRSGAILGSTGGMIQSMYWPFFFSLGGKSLHLLSSISNISNRSDWFWSTTISLDSSR